MTQAQSPALIAVDWGTTSLRCYLCDRDGNILEDHASTAGILQTGDRPFDDILAGAIAPWRRQTSANDKNIPILMSGMIGSRQGWHETEYLNCPEPVNSLAGSLSPINTDHEALAGHTIHIIPGMDIRATSGLPDIMRGEETQVLGALLTNEITNGLFVLPGTHSKWLRVENDIVWDFKTFMTGEIYAALLNHTILGKFADDRTFNGDAFENGVKVSKEFDAWGSSTGNFMHLIFSARSGVLAGDRPPEHTASYLSGLLIGAELLSATANSTQTGPTTARAESLRASEQQNNATARAASPRASEQHRKPTVHIIAGEPLQTRYQTAAAVLGLQANPVPETCVVHGHLGIARAANLVS